MNSGMATRPTFFTQRPMPFQGTTGQAQVPGFVQPIYNNRFPLLPPAMFTGMQIMASQRFNLGSMLNCTPTNMLQTPFLRQKTPHQPKFSESQKKQGRHWQRNHQENRQRNETERTNKAQTATLPSPIKNNPVTSDLTDPELGERSNATRTNDASNSQHGAIVMACDLEGLGDIVSLAPSDEPFLLPCQESKFRNRLMFSGKADFIADDWKLREDDALLMSAINFETGDGYITSFVDDSHQIFRTHWTPTLSDIPFFMGKRQEKLDILLSTNDIQLHPRLEESCESRDCFFHKGRSLLLT